MEKTYPQNIEGYIPETYINNIPHYSGVYFVYTGTWNKNENTVFLRQLIYIGTAESINSRLSNHEKINDWKKYLKSGEDLFFSYTQVDEKKRERVEAAYIYKHQPPANTDCKDSFNYDETAIISTGETHALETNFTVKGT